MSKVFLLFFFLLPSLLFAQSKKDSLEIKPRNSSPTIFKTWIGENLEYLEIASTNAKFDYGYGLNDYGSSFNDSTITLYEGDKFGKQHSEYVYKVLQLTDDSLIVSSLSEGAAMLIHGKQKFDFVDRSRLYNPDLKFQRIFFSGTICFGTCPAFKIEIDSSGLTYFEAGANTGISPGLYKGHLSKKQLDDLVEILKSSGLDRFPTHLGSAIDAPIYSFKFHYKYKTKSSTGFFIPYFDRPMLDYLLTIYKQLSLQKTDETYEFGK
jgi:hypothetical protein